MIDPALGATRRQQALTRLAGLSIAAALATMGLKLLAWQLTGSVGLLSDALESVVNLGAALMLLLLVRIAAMPADEGHPYGHDKAEYFSSGFEGTLILLAGACILVSAISRLLAPRPVEQAIAGLALCGLASAINAAVASVLGAAATRHGSAALRADAAHLMTDVWTSAGVIAGVALVAATGWNVLDPIIAIAVALHILRTGFGLVREALSGLMDAAWPEEQQRSLDEVLDRHRAAGLAFHAIRTRRAGARHFVSFHVLVPGDWSVQRAHAYVDEMEGEIAARVPRLSIVTHIEPIEDPGSYADAGLDR